MALPFVGVPTLIQKGLAPYRDLFCREAGFEHVSRYVTGLLLSPNKTLQGIYDQQVWPGGCGVSRRAMHAGVFEAGWDSEGLLPRHRAVVFSVAMWRVPHHAYHQRHRYKAAEA